MLNRILFSVVVALSLGSHARGDVITFLNAPEQPLVPTVEGAFTYQRVSGEDWFTTNLVGNPPSSLGTSVPDVGESVEFFLTGGGLFTFDSFDVASFANSVLSDTVDFFGEVNSVQTEQQLGIDSNSTTWQTIASTFQNPIDRLVVQVSAFNTTSIILDNFVLTPVPEPSAFLFGGLVAVLAGGCCWLRRRS